ncbi:RING-type E3 ubiquitin transferase [Malassezia cuniculi]|uniref:Pre-mRNA-processing factor 19 n=1 Tax=Malassezia cuniculi TaxID=948313 RepID=A0AAF0ESS3_9BASI|nr:RING-type E3 ubiquitin transferase [Malassezia cuniculi]
MFCAISGEAPTEPVVSKKSGLVYEKRLIESYIAEHGKDPVTGEELSVDDLIVVKVSPRTAFPRPPSHTSVPSLLTALQNEYDAVMLEMLTLKQQYDDVRQELAHALYTNDASMRVIARLMKERDEARESLASVHTTLGAAASGPSDVDMASAEDVPQESVPLATAASIDALAGSLSSERRARIKRGAPEGYTTAADAKSLAVASSIDSPHSTNAPEITAVAVAGSLVVTGGVDKHVVVYDLANNSVVATLDGHTQPVSTVAVSGVGNPVAGESPVEVKYIVSGSEDQTVRVWRAEGGTYEFAHAIELAAPVVGVAVHPTDEIVGVATRDGTWALYMLATGERLLQVTAPADAQVHGGFSYASLAFHPDGQLVATGTADGVVRVWDVKHGKQSAAFAGHGGAVHSLDFSQNGYLLAAAARGAAEVKIWDLRKLDVSRTVSASENVQSVRFDPTAQLLAVAGADTRVFTGKTFAHAVTVETDGPAAGAVWSAADGALVVAARALQVLRA